MSARLPTLLISLVSVFSPAVRATAPLPEAVQACRKESDDAKRLACFDREVARATAKAQNNIGLSPAQERKLEPATPPVSAPPSPDTATVPSGAAKSSATKAAAAAPLLASTILRIARNAQGRYVILLANGETWIQGEAWDVFDGKVGDTVTIKTGLLGSFHMRSASGSETRVTRAR